MMFSGKDIDIISDELRAIARSSPVSVFGLHGSRAAGRASRDSDLDYFMLFTGRARKVIPKIVRRVDKETSLQLKDYNIDLVKHIGFYGSHFSSDGRKVSIHFLERKVLERNLKDLYSSEDNFYALQGFARGWVQEATVIYDKANTYPRFRKMVRYDPDFRKKIIKGKLAQARGLVPYFRKAAEGDYYVFYDYLRIMLRFIIDIHYLKNSCYQISHFKGLKQDLRKQKPDIGTEVRYLMEKPNSGLYRKRKVRIVSRLLGVPVK